MLFRSMLSAGLLGKKTGQGFYRYDEAGKKISPPQEKLPSLWPSSVWLSPNYAPHNMIVRSLIEDLVKQAGLILEQGEQPGAQALCIVTPLGQDASTCCVSLGLDASRTVAVESLFDLSRRRLVMSTPATSATYRAMACTLLSVDGAAVSLIRDSAGLVAQRVVAQLINVRSEERRVGKECRL